MIIEDFVSHNIQIAVIGTHQWSVSRLIQLSKDFPVLEIPLNHLYIWYRYKDLRLRDLVMHMKAVNNADLSYPIILDEDGEVMDGRHRIMKAMLTNQNTIKAVRFEKNPNPCKINES